MTLWFHLIRFLKPPVVTMARDTNTDPSYDCTTDPDMVLGNSLVSVNIIALVEGMTTQVRMVLAAA